MDNHAASWAPRRQLAILAWVFAAVCAAVTAVLLIGGDAAGPLLLVIATIALIVFACYTTFARPRLAADHQGLRIRTLNGTRSFSWAEATAKLVTTRRLGRDVTTLEIDTGEHAPHLIVLGRLELDADPADVLEVLNDLRGVR